MHYHTEIPWVSDEYQSDSFDDLFSALDTIATELDRAGDYEYEGISLNGEAGEYQQAYEAWVTSNALTNALLNVRNIVDQHEGYKPRAPLYEGENGTALLREAAQRFLTGDPWQNLPLRYTPAVWACNVADDQCDQRKADNEAREL